MKSVYQVIIFVLTLTVYLQYHNYQILVEQNGSLMKETYKLAGQREKLEHELYCITGRT